MPAAVPPESCIVAENASEGAATRPCLLSTRPEAAGVSTSSHPRLSSRPSRFASAVIDGAGAHEALAQIIVRTGLSFDFIVNLELSPVLIRVRRPKL